VPFLDYRLDLEIRYYVNYKIILDLSDDILHIDEFCECIRVVGGTGSLLDRAVAKGLPLHIELECVMNQALRVAGCLYLGKKVCLNDVMVLQRR
jgi:hypothetical protein